MSAREWLHCQVNPLMSLQIVIAIEGLRALVALERSVVLLRLLAWVVSIHGWSAHWVTWVLHVHASYERHLSARTVYIR